MTNTAKRKRSFIGKDPIYTRAPSVPVPAPVADPVEHKVAERPSEDADRPVRDEGA